MKTLTFPICSTNFSEHILFKICKYDVKNNIYILGSKNIKQKNIGDQINPFDLRKKYIEKIDLRLLEINKKDVWGDGF